MQPGRSTSGRSSQGARTVAVAVGRLAFLCVILSERSLAQAELPQAPTSRADSAWLRLNVPAFRLELLTNDRVLALYGVAPGARRYATPLGRFQLTRIEWNPWWIPPDREWARGERDTPPGPDNPMGRVKLFFRPYYFLHGTPFESSIGSAASHGCVRMRNADAIELATRLLRQDGSSFLEDSVRAILSSRATRTITFARPVPVHIRYELVEVEGDSLYLHRDVYALGGLTLGAVRHVLGADSLDMDATIVSALLRAAARRSVVVPLDSVLRRPRIYDPMGPPHVGRRTDGGGLLSYAATSRARVTSRKPSGGPCDDHCPD
jgi:hypothetical protein